ncbi:MAG: glucokinase [Burkholderiales bacterium]|nr:glucokinase [Burkholderiales bacterium]
MTTITSPRHCLVGDVGGTKTEIMLVAAGASERPVLRQAYASREYAGLPPILEDFLARPEAAGHAGAIAAACFAVAGPVDAGSVTLTNLGWQIGSGELALRFRLPQVALINDFAATGLGITRLAHGDLLTLQAGRVAAHGARVVIGAGTGLGVGLLTWEEERYVVHPSEAGHADFAPADELQDRLLAYLRGNFDRVSCERVISGPGLMRIFSFLQDTGVGVPSRQLLEATRRQADPAEVIAEFALARLDPLAVRALDLFIAAYGAFAGNMALSALARGGVYIAGGIAPKIAARLQEGGFIRAFGHKGRFAELLSAIPVHVVMNRQVALLGALEVAERL